MPTRRRAERRTEPGSTTVAAWLERAWSRLRDAERESRPRRPEALAAMRRRWSELPERVRTPAQMLGRAAVGCEGTHGVFPRCNLTCSPCYHAAGANRVAVDGTHTLGEVTAQMALLREVRGPRAHAQLIGGEVTLLDPDDHAAALLAMRAAGRDPMSMTHGDVDPDYLERLVRAPGGGVRLPRVSFAVHVDSLMRGRRGAVRPRSEAELHEHRRRVVAMFADLRRRLGVRSYLAHNMTVTAGNLDEVGDVAREASRMGYQMLSFQPAALVGDDRRWPADHVDLDVDTVWRHLEDGLGQPLRWEALQWGDERCNRTAPGALVGERWVPLLDPDDPADLALRDLCLTHHGSLGLDAARPSLVAARLLRAGLAHPTHVAAVAGWARRAVRRSGGPRRVLRAVVRGELRPLTFVVHAFMDAALVQRAWADANAGRVSQHEEVRAAQERLAACSYHMAHPATGELVPACVQHSVLDPGENQRLAVLLPLPTVRSGAASARR